MTTESASRWRLLRVLPWIVAAVLLMSPAIAMQFRVEGVAWTGSDFLAMGLLLFFACGSFELAARVAPNFTYLLAAALAIGTGFLLVWANLAVGIIGDGIGVANAMFFGVIVVAVVGALSARLRAAGMVRAMLATVVAVVVAVLVGLVVFDATMLEASLASVFALAWLVSAGLFHLSAQGLQPSRG